LTAFEEAEGFLTGVRFIEQIRGRLSPSTGTMVNEVGMIADHLLGPNPTQFPSVTMIDWTTGRPNARYWTLKLLLVNKRDRVVTVAVAGLALASMAFVDGTTSDGVGSREIEGEAVELQPYAVAVVSIAPFRKADQLPGASPLRRGNGALEAGSR